MSDKLYSPIIYDPISKIYYKQELNTHVGIVLNAQQQFVNKLIKQRDQYKAENEELKHQWDYLYESLSSLQEDYNDLEQQYDELFRRYEMLNELI